MRPDRWKQVKRLYHAALEREPEARKAFLDEACAGDEDLRREVAELLACDVPSDSFIQSPAIEIAARAMAAEPLIEASNNPMGSLIVGSQIGAYQLLEPLGRGGMGEVHLALDTRLGRKVALKVLPVAFTTDTDRVQRFAREARAASALNHPNIITIHEIGETATENGSLRYIVTEYVEGVTLRQRLRDTPQQRMKPSEAIEIAAQIAAALSAAHEAGITHRDIKPENVMVRPDGLVKVLDFGLAKPTEPSPPVVETQAPTVAGSSTETGIIMGTPRYMSPEQARGLKADTRSDIFSLGVVLYEMVAGRAPFEGVTPIDCLAALLQTDPQPLTRFVPEVPGELEWSITRALAKDREERYQSVRDFFFDLNRIKQRLEFEAELRRQGDKETQILPSLPFSFPPSLTFSLVGRKAELARLQSWLEKAQRGQRQVVFVTGEPGIGKTSLIDVFLARAANEPGLWMTRGQCLEQYGASEAYLPVLEALAQLCREPGAERFVALLRRQAPLWLQQMPWLTSSDERDQLQRATLGATRGRMLREMAEFLESFTSDSLLVLVMEDLHWSDYSTLDLIALLARRPGPARLLLLGTYRPVEVSLSSHPLRAIKQELRMHKQCAELPLGLLSEGMVSEYLAARFPGSEPPVKLARMIHRRTDGNPLFMVNLVDYLIAHGLIVESDGRWEAPDEMEKLEVGVPEDIRQVIEKQIERLSLEEQRVLETASVVGVEFSAIAVAAGLEEEGVWVEERCEELQRRQQFLRAAGTGELPDGRATTRYSFIHVLYQNMLYERVAATRRAQLHQRIGEQGEMAYGERAGEIAAELATHFEQGRDFQRAIKYLRHAAENAAGRYAYQDTIILAHRGLELLQKQSDSAERARQELPLQLALGMSLIATRGFSAPEAEQPLSRACALCQQSGESLQLFTALAGLYTVYEARGDLQMARQLAEQLLRLSESSQDPALSVVTHLTQGRLLHYFGEPGAAEVHFERALALNERALAHNPPEHYLSYLTIIYMHPIAVCQSDSAWSLWLLGYPDRALDRVREAHKLAQQLADPLSLVYALMFAAGVHYLRGEWLASQEQAEAALALAREHDLAFFLGWLTASRSFALTRQGRLEEGITQIRDGLAARGSKDQLGYTAICAMVAENLGQAGQIAEGLTMLSKGLAFTERTGERFYEAEMYRVKGELLLKMEDRGLKIEENDTPPSILGPQCSSPDECFHQAIKIARRQEAKSWELRAVMSLSRLWQREGKREEACELLAGIYGWYTEGFDTADLQEAKALLEELSLY
jgi:serine/threonine protein kinase/tetratricopeptide (TPR) repeat protein